MLEHAANCICVLKSCSPSTPLYICHGTIIRCWSHCLPHACLRHHRQAGERHYVYSNHRFCQWLMCHTVLIRLCVLCFSVGGQDRTAAYQSRGSNHWRLCCRDQLHSASKCVCVWSCMQRVLLESQEAFRGEMWDGLHMGSRVSISVWMGVWVGLSV